MRNRLLIMLMLAGLLGAGTGCWRSSNACRNDSDCNGAKKCLQSGGVVFGNGVCVRPCTTERLRELCREQGGTCSGEFCIESNPDAVGVDGRPDACIRPDDYEFCESRGLPCGPENNPVEGRDRCGNRRDVDCHSLIDFETEEQHCGSCGNECEFSNADGTHNADGGCREGSCVIDSCSDGYLDKDGDGSNGCECEVTEEICDGRDNDCDGVVDNDCSCDYERNPEGVCGDQMPDENGNCQKPADYEPDETSCDGKDNDCDGETDEGLEATYYEDRDGDGYGDSSSTTEACSNPDESVWVEMAGDCDDDDADLHPGRDEQCSTSADDNCDGAVNENCPCDYDGKTEGVCDQAARDESGNCQPPADYESPETACADGVDNDCDGAADASDTDCHCDYDGTSEGVCGDAVRDNTGSCREPASYEATEATCDDGVDNDCDGAADLNDNDCS